MSTRSMTGFGSGSARGAGMRVSAEIGSVNRKTLDIRTSIPPTIKFVEADVQKLVAASLARGAVNCAISIEWTRKVRARAVKVDETLAGAYIDSIRSVSERLGLRGEIGPALLLDLPNVVELEMPAIDDDELRTVVLRAVKAALKKMNDMRRREGHALGKDVSARIDMLEEMAVEIDKRKPAATEKHRRRLEQVIAEAGLAPDEERLRREIVFHADKADINEELTRLESHFDQARGFIKSKQPAGRSLEFLSQELLREINTIASKSPDAIIAGIAIQFKSELERLREQIRNLE